MRLNFGENDEDEYFEIRDELLDEIEQSFDAGQGWKDDTSQLVGSISMFIDWRWNHSSGQLDDWSLGDVDEFLLDCLPLKDAAPPERCC